MNNSNRDDNRLEHCFSDRLLEGGLAKWVSKKRLVTLGREVE